MQEEKFISWKDHRAGKMNDLAPSADLISLVQESLASREEAMKRELAAKYLLCEDEASDIVSSFLQRSYGPAFALTEEIARREGTVLLFIGRKDCAICQRCQPILSEFILEHKDIEPVILDYSQPEGLLYHLIHRDEQGMLPLIAFISCGKIMMKSCGECAAIQIYDEHYRNMSEECRQNIYVH
ncbi:hypothetical protein [Methanothrix sp.]|uniref:hypothetical protein n=1 Tax=Methanothrix sp. TaxID=90426 RepID=UPI003C7391AF